MSKVFHAYDNKLGRIVCLKLLDKVKTAKFEERFTNQGLDKPSEGAVCMALKHPNCVATYEHGITTKGEPYLVMEWIDGLGLNYLIETKSPQLNGNRINYLKQLCDAVEYLHDQKFLHRDLCPRNVMVTKEGVVKLIDFGLTIPYTPDFCRPGNRTGTADYLAPEIIKRQTTDHRVDLFALGVTAFEIFTGAAAVGAVAVERGDAAAAPEHAAARPEGPEPGAGRRPVCGLCGRRSPRSRPTATRRLGAPTRRSSTWNGTTTENRGVRLKSAAAATAAVSTRRIRGPRHSNSQPASSASCTSSSLNPPSGPTATSCDA